MKYFIAVFVCALAATALARPEIDKDAAKESGRRLKEAHEKCQADPASAVDEDALKNLKKGGAPPANSGAHALCVSKALGWQNADGSVNKVNIEARAKAIFGDNPKLQTIIDECSVPQANEEATATHLFQCYRKYAPHHDHQGPHDHHEQE